MASYKQIPWLDSGADLTDSAYANTARLGKDGAVWVKTSGTVPTSDTNLYRPGPTGNYWAREYTLIAASMLAQSTSITESKIRRNTTSQSISTATATAISFDTETNDPLNVWDVANPTRITIPGSGNKTARLYVQVNFAANNNGYRQIQVAQNGTPLFYENINAISTASSQSTIMRATFEVYCVGGDYLELLATQNTGGALTLNAQVIAQIFDRL